MNRHTQHSMPVGGGGATEGREVSVATFLLPYIANVSYQDLANILDDEGHHVADFRTAMTDLLKVAAASPQAAVEAMQDKVRPALDKIERKFKIICSMHSLKIGGTVLGTVVATLSALLLGPGIAVAATTGAGGLAFVAREWGDLLKSNHELKELPFYLLWRLGRANQV
jgi:hypothetical protein